MCGENIVILGVNRGEVITSCFHGSRISGWQQTKKIT